MIQSRDLVFYMLISFVSNFYYLFIKAKYFMFFAMYDLYNHALFSIFSSLHPRQNHFFYLSGKTLSVFFHIVYDAILNSWSIVPINNWNLFWLSIVFYMREIFLRYGYLVCTSKLVSSPPLEMVQFFPDVMYFIKCGHRAAGYMLY